MTISSKKCALTLFTALGTNEMLIIELLDFLSGQEKFSYNTEAKKIREEFKECTVKRLVLVCTTHKKVIDTFNKLQKIIAREYSNIIIEKVDLGFEDVKTTSHDLKMRDEIYKTIKSYAGSQLVISSGGRKTITQRIIEAGLLYGCRGYLSITAPPGKEQKHDVRYITEDFSVLWIPGRQFIKERQNDLIKDEVGDSFRSVYLFPNTALESLMNQTINDSPDDLNWLKRLPKADLHCHLGGCQDEHLQKELAQIIIEECEISFDKKTQVIDMLEKDLRVNLELVEPRHLHNLLPDYKGVHCLQVFQEYLSNSHDFKPHEIAAVFIDSLTVQQLQKLNRDGRIDSNGEISWPERNTSSLDWYMACGNLGGSTLLQTKGTLERALQHLIEEANRENVKYLEIRCSPANYTKGGLSDVEVMEILLQAAENSQSVRDGSIRVNFLLTATRHKKLAEIDRNIALAIIFSKSRKSVSPSVVGFDLAGQEDKNKPSKFKNAFLPLHRACINITIHAGEMASQESIWEAIYVLHARRIGHGLKLVNSLEMMDFARDHNLAIEMCPSSNWQTNSFIDYGRSESDKNQQEYPLKTYLRHGIRVTVNTDNRFISNTTLSNEYLMASRLTKDGLTKWEALKLVKNGFKAAFLPKDLKDKLLKEVDREIFGILLDEAFPSSNYFGLENE